MKSEIRFKSSSRRKPKGFFVIASSSLLFFLLMWNQVIRFLSMETMRTSIFQENRRLEAMMDMPTTTIINKNIHPEMVTDVVKNDSMKMGVMSQQPEIQRQQQRSSLLVIAAFPANENRIYALWSQLECLTSKFDHIIISAPSWSNRIVDTVIEHAKRFIPSLEGKHIEGRYHLNDRYDVGLWCDSLVKEEHRGGFYDNSNNAKREVGDILHKEFDDTDNFVLINDSIWALEHSSELLDTLREKNLTMISLNYVDERKNASKGLWLESVYRGFNLGGIQKFLKHSCVPRIHPYYCNDKKLPKQRKRCIVEHFEIEIANLFQEQPELLLGLYPAVAPNRLADSKGLDWGWVTNWKYWNHLRQMYNFPVAKIHTYHLEMTKKEHPNDLKTCVTGLESFNTSSILFSQLDFEEAEYDSAYKAK